MATIHNIYNEAKRLCGYRSPGLYLIGDGPMSSCDGLPIPLERCPVCDQGIKFSRGITFIKPQALFPAKSCARRYCNFCPVSHPPEKAGLLWIGEGTYPTPGHWTSEAILQGVSRRLSHIPRGLTIGEDHIYVAHRKAIDKRAEDGSMIKVPGIFHAFRPTYVEYVVSGEETEQKLDKLESRGVRLVQLVWQKDEILPGFQTEVTQASV